LILYTILGHWSIDFGFVDMGGYRYFILSRDRKNRSQELRIGRYGDVDHVCSWCCGKSSVSDIINDNIYLNFCHQWWFMHSKAHHIICFYNNGNYNVHNV